MRLNHANLIVDDVLATAAFFERGFAFRARDRRPSMVILEGEDGFVLILMKPSAQERADYPKNFHLGFLIQGEQAVRAKHAELVDAGFAPNDVAELTRAGGTTFTFYCHAPGGILVEVSGRP